MTHAVAWSLYLLLCEVWKLLLYRGVQQLLLESLDGDGEVQQGHLDLQVGTKHGVREPRLHVNVPPTIKCINILGVCCQRCAGTFAHLHLRGVFRIRQLGDHDEPEVGVIGHRVVAEPDHILSTLLELLLKQDGL